MTGSPALCTRSVGEPPALGALLLLGVALLIALGFEFVNGFHDTAVTTVISTHSLPPAPAGMAFSRKSKSIPGLRQNPKILRVYDSEVVSH
jgi:hypothetical protein